jgi:hypothetical protein
MPGFSVPMRAISQSAWLNQGSALMPKGAQFGFGANTTDHGF